MYFVVQPIFLLYHPHHITQNGNNRATIFLDYEDNHICLILFAQYALKHDIVWFNHMALTAGTENDLRTYCNLGQPNKRVGGITFKRGTTPNCY
jgi:hypothetical protein